MCDLPRLKYGKYPRMNNSNEYDERKAFFDSLLTIYGRKPVLEALQDREIKPFRLHLAESNKQAGIIQELQQLAERQGAEVLYHSRDALSRISKNKKQDQGVVLDIAAPSYRHISSLQVSAQRELIAVENITNPQNLGMIIRSVGASPMAGVIIPKKGCAPLDALVIKASAGAIFKTAIYYCDDLLQEMPTLKQLGYEFLGLAGQGKTPLNRLTNRSPSIFLLGNETVGLSESMINACDDLVHIPMQNGVESLNVSIAASLVAFRSMYRE